MGRWPPSESTDMTAPKGIPMNATADINAADCPDDCTCIFCVPGA